VLTREARITRPGLLVALAAAAVTASAFAVGLALRTRDSRPRVEGRAPTTDVPRPGAVDVARLAGRVAIYPIHGAGWWMSPEDSIAGDLLLCADPALLSLATGDEIALRKDTRARLWHEPGRVVLVVETGAAFVDLFASEVPLELRSGTASSVLKRGSTAAAEDGAVRPGPAPEWAAALRQTGRIPPPPDGVPGLRDRALPVPLQGDRAPVGPPLPLPAGRRALASALVRAEGAPLEASLAMMHTEGTDPTIARSRPLTAQWRRVAVELAGRPESASATLAILASRGSAWVEDLRVVVTDEAK
jgi:hypothetical protein